jgi:hypothetical protein
MLSERLAGMIDEELHGKGHNTCAGQQLEKQEK